MKEDEILLPLLGPGKSSHELEEYVLEDFFKKGNKTKPAKTEIHWAAEVGDLKRLENLLKERPNDVRACDPDGYIPLHLAVRGLHYQCCKVLLDYTKSNKEVNLIDKHGNTALHLSVGTGERSSEVSQLLIDRGANVKIANKGKQTSLHLAAQKGNDLLVQQIVNICPQLVVTKDSEKKTPLHLAAQYGMQKSCKLLLTNSEESNNERDMYGLTALHWAAKMAFTECCEYLVDGGCNVNCKDKFGNTPLHLACCSRKEFRKNECVEILLKKGADIMLLNNNGKTVLHTAIEKGNGKTVVSIVDSLISHARVMGVEINSLVNMKDNGGIIALHSAIEKGYNKICQQLVKFGTDMNLQQGERGTVLHIAATKGRYEICEFLINKGIKADLLDKSRRTPLHLAAINGHHKCCEILLKKQMKHSAQDEKGNTALHYAAHWKHSECCNVFMRLQPIAVTKPDKDGLTPLHIAIKQHSLECCKELITDTTDVWLRHGDTPSPVKYAFQEDLCDIFNLLITSKTSWSKREKKDIDFGNLLRDCFDEMETSLDMHRNIASSIINSCHWREALGDHVNHTDNGNFKTLVKHLPETAKVVLDKCTSSKNAPGSSNEKEKTCDKGKQLTKGVDGSSMPSKGTKETALSSSEDEEGCPFYDMLYLDPKYYLKPENTKCAEVNQTLSEVEEQRMKVIVNRAWRTNHTLSYMIAGQHHKLLDHPLVTYWINYKWQTYARYIHYCYIFIASLLAFLLTFFTALSTDWHYMKVTYNLTQSVVCAHNKSMRAGPEVVIFLHDVGRAPQAIGYVIISIVGMLFIHDIYRIIQLRRRYITWENAIFTVCGILSIIFVANYTWCSQLTWLREDWQWTVGLVAIFAAWLHILIVMRHLPLFTPFMFRLSLLFSTGIKAAIPLIVVLVGILATQWITTKGMIAYNQNWSSISMVFSNPAVSTGLLVVVTVTLCIILLGEGRRQQIDQYEKRQRIQVIQTILDIELLYPYLRNRYHEHTFCNESLHAKIIDDDPINEMTTDKKLDALQDSMWNQIETIKPFVQQCVINQSETFSSKLESINYQITTMQRIISKQDEDLHKGTYNDLAKHSSNVLT